MSSAIAEGIVTCILSALIDDGFEVEVSETPDVSVLTIYTADENRGKVIGRGGRIIEAIKHILHAVGGRQGHRYFVYLAETDAGRLGDTNVVVEDQNDQHSPPETGRSGRQS